MAHINVPHDLGDKGLVRFFAGWYWNTAPGSVVRINFDTCEFIAPYAVTLFSAYALRLKHLLKCTLIFQIDPTSTVGKYLTQVGFLELMGEPSLPAENPNAERTLKLTQISDSAQIPKFSNSVMDILHIEDEELAGAVKYSLIELLRNVVQHSGTIVGGVAMAQFYPKTGLVNVCVADMGLGLKMTIRSAYPEIDTNLQALKLATLPHVSGTFKHGGYSSMGDNAGLGLFFIKQIASLAGGGFFLASMDALVDIWGDPSGQQHKLYKHSEVGGWPGTFAYLQLRKDSIAEFDAVLATCRRMAAAAQKYPAELALDFVEDIPEIGNDKDEMVIYDVKNFEEDVQEAARLRDHDLIPTLRAGRSLVVINFEGVKFATQSFVHALMYKVIRDVQNIGSTLAIAKCSNATREAVLAVAAYAKEGGPDA